MIGPKKNHETKNAFKKQIDRLGWLIGDHTYGVPIVFALGTGTLNIGKFCSIAAGVRIALGNHRTDFGSTYPFSQLRAYWDNVPIGISDRTTKGNVVIGSDVWIGTNSFIGSGVTVGHGAVIGAQSTIVKDVSPYSIVAGNPARVIKLLFPEETIERLLAVRWWDLDDDSVERIIPFLMSSDISSLIQAVLAERSRPSKVHPATE